MRKSGAKLADDDEGEENLIGVLDEFDGVPDALAEVDVPVGIEGQSHRQRPSSTTSLICERRLDSLVRFPASRNIGDVTPLVPDIGKPDGFGQRVNRGFVETLARGARARTQCAVDRCRNAADRGTACNEYRLCMHHVQSRAVPGVGLDSG